MNFVEKSEAPQIPPKLPTPPPQNAPAISSASAVHPMPSAPAAPPVPIALPASSETHPPIEDQPSHEPPATSRQSSHHSATGNSLNSASNRGSSGQKRRKEVIVIGDSTTRDLNGYLMSRKDFRVTNHSLSGCNVEEMNLLARSLCTRKPDILVLHVGTNSLYPKSGRDTESSNKRPMTPEQVAEGINSMVKELKKEYPGMSIIGPWLKTEGTYKITVVRPYVCLYVHMYIT